MTPSIPILPLLYSHIDYNLKNKDGASQNFLIGII